MCTTLTVGSFFQTRKVHFFVHLFNNLNYGGSKHSSLRSASKTKRRSKTRPESRKHTKDPTFFSALSDFFSKFFGLHQRVPPSFVSIFCNTMDVKKSQRVPPFTFFGTVTLFKNHIKKKLGKFFKVKGPPFYYFEP